VKYLRAQGFLVATVGHEISISSVPDTLASAETVAAAIVANFPPRDGITDCGKRVLHQKLGVAITRRKAN
jgi:hypothetical protein